MKTVLKKLLTLTLIGSIIAALSGCAYEFDQQYRQKQQNQQNQQGSQNQQNSQNQKNQQTMAANNLENAPLPPNVA